MMGRSRPEGERMAGALVAIEGIDQAGKLTQARAIQAHARGRGIACAVRHYPDYQTPVGQLVQRALHDEIRLADRARTMLFAANRWEKDDEMRAIADWQSSPLFDDKDKAVLRYTDELSRNSSVSDELYAELQRHFSEQEIVKLCVAVSFAGLVNRVHATFRTEVDDLTLDSVADAPFCLIHQNA